MRAIFSACLLWAAASWAAAAPTMTTASVVCLHKEDKETLFLSWDGTWLRIEQPSRRFGLLYHAPDGEITGLEERDAYYWKFNWPQVAAAVRKQQGGKNVLNQPLPGFPAGAHDASHDGRWLWHFEGGDGKEKTWEAAGEGTRAVLARTPFLEKPDPLAAAKLALWKRFALAADVVRLVAVRELAPDGIDPLFASLPAEAGCPASLTWIEHGETRDVLTLADFRKDVPREEKRFAVPKDFRSTDLDALDGILKEAPPPSKAVMGEDLPPVNTGEELMPTP